MAHLAAAADNPGEPVTILWGDNYMSDVPTFLSLLEAAEALIRDGEAEIIFMGETPRFANENLGWIGLGEEKDKVEGHPYFAFESFRYRPPLDVAQKMYESGEFVWNTGYFVTSVGFVWDLYQTHQPAMGSQLREIKNAIGTATYEDVLHRIYPQLEVISFDDAILTYVAREQAVVLHGEMGWSDPGTLYALKEALASAAEENVVKGRVLASDTSDSLLFNEEEEKLMAVIGLEGMIVVNTRDAILVVHKSQIPQVKQFVNRLEGTELEKYS
jgi:mannose-1-phosphate guanylyltransferase